MAVTSITAFVVAIFAARGTALLFHEAKSTSC
jgi:hypothetical protein